MLDFQFGETKLPKYIKLNEYNNDEIKNQKPCVLTSKEYVQNVIKERFEAFYFSEQFAFEPR